MQQYTSFSFDPSYCLSLNLDTFFEAEIYCKENILKNGVAKTIWGFTKFEPVIICQILSSKINYQHFLTKNKIIHYYGRETLKVPKFPHKHCITYLATELSHISFKPTSYNLPTLTYWKTIIFKNLF